MRRRGLPLSPKVAPGERDPCPTAGDGIGGTGSSLDPGGLAKGGTRGKILFLLLALGRAGLLGAVMGMGSHVGVVLSLKTK